MAKTLDASPAYGAAAVTKSDTTIVGARSLYIGGAGDLAIIPVDGGSTTVTFVGVPAGTIMPVYAWKVMAATTATNIVALY